MCPDVVRMWVAAIFVVGHDHLRSKLSDELHQRCGGVLEGNQSETVRREWIAIIGKARIYESEPAVIDTHGGLGIRHLYAAPSGHVTAGGRMTDEDLVQHVTALTTRATGHHDVRTTARVVRIGRRALTRLVVGVGVYGKQTQCQLAPLDTNSLVTRLEG